MSNVAYTHTSTRYNNGVWSGSATIITTNGESTTITDDHENFQKIMEAIKNEDLDMIQSLMDVKSRFEGYVIGTGLQVRGHTVYLGDQPIRNSATEYLVSRMDQGLPVTGIPEFIERAAQADDDVFSRLFDFLLAGNNRIHPDGTFSAYKRVRGDYTSVHDGKTRNDVGTYVEMPRGLVEKNQDKTCSSGLHVCSFSYLKHFSGARVLECIVDPADVVSIPTDYNDAKMRVCKYFVKADITDTYAGDPLAEKVEEEEEEEKKFLTWDDVRIGLEVFHEDSGWCEIADVWVSGGRRKIEVVVEDSCGSSMIFEEHEFDQFTFESQWF